MSSKESSASRANDDGATKGMWQHRGLDPGGNSRACSGQRAQGGIAGVAWPGLGLGSVLLGVPSSSGCPRVLWVGLWCCSQSQHEGFPMSWNSGNGQETQIWEWQCPPGRNLGSIPGHWGCGWCSWRQSSSCSAVPSSSLLSPALCPLTSWSLPGGCS